MIKETDMPHPFKDGVKCANITKKHVPLIWECMLGTVYARSPDGTVKYFNYDWTAARAFADVDHHNDLRVSRVKTSYQGWPAKGKYALWGVNFN